RHVCQGATPFRGGGCARVARMRRARVAAGFCVVLTGVVAALMVPPPAYAKTTSLGKVTVRGAPGETPKLSFSKPFTTRSSTSRTVVPGSGAMLHAGARVIVGYLVVDGRTGKALTSTYRSAASEAFTLDTNTTPAVVRALVGSTLGS